MRPHAMIRSMLSVAITCFVLASCSKQQAAETTATEPLLYPIKENSKWGYMDGSGKIIVEPSFDHAWDFSSGIGRFKKDGKYGFVNAQGEVIIPASLAYADDFKGDFARVNTKDTAVADVFYGGWDLYSHWTYANKKGIVFTQTFAMAQSVSNGYGAVKDEVNYDQPFSYVSFDNGEMIKNDHITEAIFSYNGHNVAPASDSETGKVGLIDKQENWVLPASFDQIEPMSEGLAAAKKDNVYGYINERGEWIYQRVVSVDERYYLASDFKAFSKGLAAVKVTKDSYGYITKEGKPAFKQRFKVANSFGPEGYAIVENEAGGALIDMSGNFVIKPHLNILSITGNIVIYRTNDGVGARDLKTQKDIVAPAHTEVQMVGELLRIRDEGETAGYINKAGQFVIEPQFTSAWEFKKGKAIVLHKNKMVYIDKTGNILGDVPESENPYGSNSASMYPWMDDSGKFGFGKTYDQGYIIPASYDFAADFEGNLARVNIGAAMNEEIYAYQGGKWGIIDEKGATILAPTYELILPFRNNIAMFNVGGTGTYTMCEAECEESVYYACSGGKWGLLNTKGSVVSEAVYDRIIPFGANYLVQQNEAFGIIDAKGSVLYPVQLALNLALDESTIIELTESNFIQAKENGKAGIIDTNGKWIVTPQFEAVLIAGESAKTPFVEGLLPVKSGEFWGVADQTGAPIIPASYEEIRIFKNGFAAVKKDGRWGFIDKANTLVIPATFAAVRDFQGDVAIVQETAEGPESVINAKGETVFKADPSISLSYEGFKEGLCVIMSNDQGGEVGTGISTVGVINNKGKVLFNSKALTEAIIQASGLLQVGQNGKWALANNKGAMLTGFIYDYIEPYTGQDLIRCNVGGEYGEMDMPFYGGSWGLLNREGKLVVPMMFSEIGEFVDGLAPARSAEDLDVISYVDLSGKVIREARK